ncbi:MAG: DegT/DnrJ/EryC1/StrS family aminotransferase [Bacteroidales bacterium]|nr:DegT/DnrJ/EryC1/StrS family aminotransferase [Bacteroidales bacterium]
MKKIQMVDLQGQYQKIKSEIDGAIQRIIDSAAFVKGPEVKEFERELARYLNVRHVIACGNGTDALQIALMVLNLKPGDEVITPDFTFIATVEVIALLGLKPVLVDVNPDDFTLCMESLKKSIHKKTRVILPVHLFGQCSNMEQIQMLARENNLVVIEDNAQAIGSDYRFNDGTIKKAGTLAEIGCTSFFPSKNLGCYGDGGAVCTHDDELADKLSTIMNHGMKVRYYHDIIGVNSRLDAIQAAILRVKLGYLDAYIKARQKVADYYDHAFRNSGEIIIPQRNKYSTHVFHQYTIRLRSKNRDKLKAYLESKGIPAMVYYPVPLHRQKAFRYLGLQDTDYPVTMELCNSVLSLPMHTELDDEQLEYISTAVNDFVTMQ